MKRVILAALVVILTGFSTPSLQGDVLAFESLPIGSSGFYNGDVSAGSPFRDYFSVIGTGDNFGSTEYRQIWTLGGVEFNNNYTPDFDSWSGWSWSNVNDPVTPGFLNQFASIAGGGSGLAGGGEGSSTYLMAAGQGAWLNLPDGAVPLSLDLTNSTYAALSMRDGDSFAKKFGGFSGNDADYFRVTLTGFDATNALGNVVAAMTVSLADYTFADNSMDYILEDWLRVDLASLSGSRSIRLDFESSDVGPYGLNTPLYVAMDNLALATSAVPEPGSAVFLSVLVGLSLFIVVRRRKAVPAAEGPAATEGSAD